MYLKNSKTTQLAKNRFAVDAFIGAVQMSEDGKVWQDIKPHLVRDTDGWHVENAPYYAEVEDDGTRLFCPDINEKSQYLRIPAFAQVQSLSKNVISTETKLDKQLLPNIIRMPATWGYIEYIFTNTGVQFQVYFEKATNDFGKQSPRILLDQETAGLDIKALLASKSGLGIPRPRLIDASGEERWLDWSLIAGQLELGFDLTGLKFPVLLKNTTIDEQVDAGEDDARERESTGVINLTGTSAVIYSHPNDYGRYWGGFRFVLGDSIPLGSTINVAYWSPFIANPAVDNANYNIHFEKVAAPVAFTTNNYDITSRIRTASSVSWIEDDVASSQDWYDSPSLVTPLQELVDAVSPTSIAVIIRPNQDVEKGFYIRTYENGTGQEAKLHIEYTAGGPTAQSVGNGSITPTGALSTIGMFKSSVGSGSITPSGSLGTIAKFRANVGSGTITPSGSLKKKTSKSVGNGTVSITGHLSKALVGVAEGIKHILKLILFGY